MKDSLVKIISTVCCIIAVTACGGGGTANGLCDNEDICKWLRQNSLVLDFRVPGAAFASGAPGAVLTEDSKLAIGFQLFQNGTAEQTVYVDEPAGSTKADGSPFQVNDKLCSNTDSFAYREIDGFSPQKRLAQENTRTFSSCADEVGTVYSNVIHIESETGAPGTPVLVWDINSPQDETLAVPPKTVLEDENGIALPLRICSSENLAAGRSYCLPTY